jgi:hypothetical protein
VPAVVEDAVRQISAVSRIGHVDHLDLDALLLLWRPRPYGKKPRGEKEKEKEKDKEQEKKESTTVQESLALALTNSWMASPSFESLLASMELSLVSRGDSPV